MEREVIPKKDECQGYEGTVKSLEPFMGRKVKAR
jgi:hypothetical protein